MRRAVFVDRDGVVNELVPDPISGLPESPLDPGRVALIAGAAVALRRLHDEGYVLVGVSNQPAAAKGVVALDDLESVHARVIDLLEGQGVRPDAFKLCFHHPEGVVAGLARTCDCRKPAPGLLLDATAELELDLSRSWLVGDTDDDIAAASSVGCRSILVENPGSEHKRLGSADPVARVPDLAGAVEIILRSER